MIGNQGIPRVDRIRTWLCSFLFLGLNIAYGRGVVTSLNETDLRNTMAGGGTVTFAVDGVITVTNTIVVTDAAVIDGTGHHVTVSGGGLVRVFLVEAGANLTLAQISVTDGYSDTQGGSGLLNLGTTVIDYCTFSNNVSTSSGAVPLGTGGGAIKQDPAAKSLRITRSSFIQNRSLSLTGGAISCGAETIPGGTGNIKISNSTFYKNSGFYGGGAVGLAGPFTGGISFINCTFAWNTNGAVSYGNPLSSEPQGQVPILANCILADSVGSTNATGFIDFGHNLSSDDSDIFTNAASLRNVDPLIGPLGNYGGPTLTLPLVTGSPAVDSGDDSMAPATDQRGVPRPTGSHSDIGAFEGTVPANGEFEMEFVQSEFFALGVPGTAAVGIKRIGPLDASATVNFSAQPGTAITGVDFMPTNLTVTFTNSEAEKTVEVSIFGGHPQSSSTVLLALTNPTGGILGALNKATLTIQSTNTQLLTNLTDNALRNAISLGGTIRIANDGVIVLTNTLNIDKSVLMDASQQAVTIQGNGSFRLFTVQPKAALFLQNLTIGGGAALGQSNGLTDGAPGYGGAAFVNGGILTLVNCHIWTNTARGGDGANGSGYSGSGGNAEGGAVYMVGSTLNVTNSDFVGNTAVAGAGGINSATFPDISLTGVGGSAFGGAVFGSESVLNCSNTVWSMNQVLGGMGGLAKGANILAQSSGDAMGGAIFQSGGTGTVTVCEFESNSGASKLTDGFFGNGGNVWGGAVCNSNGLFVVDGGKFFQNQVVGGDTFHHGLPGAGQGGAIANLDRARINECWFECNGAKGGTSGGSGIGGAVENTGYLQLTDSLLQANAATGGTQGGTAFGGGICNTGTLVLTNVTMTLNLAEGGYVGSWAAQPNGLGGGLYNSSGTVFCVNNTIANNSASWHWNGRISSLTNGFGGGVSTTNGSTTLLNSILATNIYGGNGYGPIVDASHNISSDASCGFSAIGSLNDTDPVIGPLGNYGGPTPTIPLLRGSPAIDSGTLAGAPKHDQRGHSRPYGNGVDIGAFESSPPYTISGKVYGFTLTDEVLVSDGTQAVVTTNGQFLLNGLASGTQTVAVTNSSYLFVPSSQELSVGPDRLDLSFHAFRWEALSPEPLTNGAAHLVLAGTIGTTWRIEASTNAIDWQTVSTNAVGSNGTLDSLLPVDSTPTILYRAVTP